MKKSILKTNFLLNLINSSLIKLPTPLNISIWWNFGFLLSFNLLMQIITGFILTMHYNSNINDAFNSVIHIIQDVNYGWLIRLMHMNGASLFFIFLFIHIGRGMYYNSFTLKKTWIIGVIIFFLVMATAFLGYVLPWGQMSFWGATVITNLISAIPYIGDMTVKWLWGGFSVNYATLSRFYSFHFILPLIVLIFVMLHLLFLHETGSTNPLGLNSNYFKIPFNPYYSLKDILGLIIVMMLFMFICMYNPYMFSDPENFNPANPMITPVHIQPEWYFLFAYAILRSIPNKLGGVIALLMSILILLIMPFTMNYNIKGFKFNYLNQLNYWMFISYFIILTFIGARPVEDPYIIIGQLISILYFSYFFIYLILSNILEKILFKQ